MFNKKTLLLLFVVLFCGLIILFLMAFVESYRRTEQQVNVKVTEKANFSKEIEAVQFWNVVIPVTTAFTYEEQKRGLSGRASLPEEEGLLFIFSKPDFYGFWMKEMQFPIDIIWINENNKIVHIARAIEPNSFPQIFKPSEKSLYVLEVNAGFAAKHAINIGDQATFITN